MKYKLLLCIFALALISTVEVSAQENYQLYKDMKGSWYYFDEYDRHQLYQPDLNLQKVFLTLDKKLPNGATLQISTKANTSLLVEDKIIDQFDGAKTSSYNLDSLFGLYEAEGFLTILLYNSRGVYIHQANIIYPNIQQSDEPVVAEIRGSLHLQNAFLIFTLISISMLVYLKSTHLDIWKGYMNWISIFSSKDSAESILYRMRPYEKGTLLIIVAYALLGATAFFGMVYISDFTLLSQFFFREDPIVVQFIKWMSVACILFILAYLKYFVVNLFAMLFDFKGALRIHFYNHIKLLIIIIIIVLFVELTLTFGIHEVILRPWTEAIVISMLFLKSFLITIKLLRVSVFRFFHLFSYLCASEIIPVIILVKIAFLL